MTTLRLFLALVVFSLLELLHVADAGAPRPKAAWRKTNWDQVEKELETGDLPELLVSEDKIAMDDYDKRRSQGLKLPEDDVPLKESNEWLRHTQAMSGPAMMFVSLKERDPKGALWTKKTLERLSGEWSAMCKTAGLEAKVYDISEGAQDQPSKTRRPTGSVTPTPTKTLPPSRMLVSMNSGWRGYDLRDFILRRPETESLEWDQVKYTPDDLDADGNFKGGVTGKNAAPIPAGLSDMAAPGQRVGGVNVPVPGGKAGKYPKHKAPSKKVVEEDDEEEEEEDEF